MFALMLRMLFLLLFMPCCAYAELKFGEYVTSHAIIAEQQAYQEVKEQLNSKTLSYYGIGEKVDALKKIQEFAFQCSIQKEKIITHIDYLKRHNKLANSQSSDEQSFYDLKRAHSVSDLSSCQALFFDIQTTLEQTNDFIKYAKNYHHENNQRSNILQILKFNNTFKTPLTLRPWDKLFKIHLERNEMITVGLWGGGILLLSLFLSAMIQRMASVVSDHKIKYILLKTANYLPFFLPLATVYHLIYNIYLDMLEPPRVLTLILIAIIYPFIRFILDCYFKISITKKNEKWFSQFKSASFLMVNIFFLLGFIRFFVLNAFEHSQTEQVFVLGYFLCTNVFLTTLMGFIIYRLTAPDYFTGQKKIRALWFRQLGLGIIISLSMVKIYLLFTGYYEFSINYLLFIFILFLVYFKFVSMLEQIENYLQSGKDPMGRKLYNLLGTPKQKNILEITFLRYALVIYSGVKFATIILWAIGVPQHYLVQFKDFFYQAHTIGHMRFIIIDFIYAGLSFCVLMLLGKIFAKKIAESSHFGQQHNLKATIALLVRYVFFSLTLIVCFLILGFNFTQITVLLGGLGLGLGVGLQSLVLDFIAGIIILIQKTIHIGDFVSIKESGNDSSGYVQKIQLLSTQIISNDQSLLYIPNSCLIKGVVNNHSAYQSIEKCVIPFDFKNNVDFEAGKMIILELVAQEANIINSGLEKPILMIDNAYRQTKQPIPDYILHLVFSVKDISFKQQTCHHLLESIYQAFANQGIKLDNEI